MQQLQKGSGIDARVLTKSISRGKECLDLFGNYIEAFLHQSCLNLLTTRTVAEQCIFKISRVKGNTELKPIISSWVISFERCFLICNSGLHYFFDICRVFRLQTLILNNIKQNIEINILRFSSNGTSYSGLKSQGRNPNAGCVWIRGIVR